MLLLSASYALSLSEASPVGTHMLCALALSRPCVILFHTRMTHTHTLLTDSVFTYHLVLFSSACSLSEDNAKSLQQELDSLANQLEDARAQRQAAERSRFGESAREKEEREEREREAREMSQRLAVLEGERKKHKEVTRVLEQKNDDLERRCR